MSQRRLTEIEFQAIRAEAEKESDAAFAALPDAGLAVEVAERHLYRWSNSYSRMEMVLRLFPRMARGDWLRVLGSAWSVCDNIRDYTSLLRRVLGTTGPLLDMMKPQEQAAYAALPDRITAHRGCSARHLTGLSWTLNRDVAQRFPTLNRYKVPDPVLITAVARKQDVLALIEDRAEGEIITFKARRLYAEPIVMSPG
jgi:hypothetical protein